MTRLTLGIFAPGLLVAAWIGAQGGEAPRATLLWGGDAEGGAPFVEADPADASQVRGFDVEVAETIARGLGRRARFLQVQWSSIDQSVERGDCAIGLSGMEDTPARRARHSVTVPYFEFREVLAVRPEDRGRFSRLADLRGRRVATLGATVAYDVLVAARDSLGLIPVSYDDDVHPYSDLIAGRVDAVLLDHIIAQRALRRRGGAGFVIQPQAVAAGRYVGVLAKGDSALRDSVDVVLRTAMRDGTLERIFRRWDVWDPGQGALFRRVAGQGEDLAVAVGAQHAAPLRPGVWAYLPSLGRAALITAVVSALAMAVAVVVGLVVASGRVYGPGPVRAVMTAYVEVIRGTPVLLQLYVLYFGLADVIALSPWSAAIIGLGLNYAAYEAEIYRGAIQAIPAAQWEAALAIGLSRRAALRHVILPQALRIAMPGVTNDFISLLKDSSLVSVITVVELTKQMTITAVDVRGWLGPGLLCAALYLALSYPLSRLARRLEQRLAPAPA